MNGVKTGDRVEVHMTGIRGRVIDIYKDGAKLSRLAATVKLENGTTAQYHVSQLVRLPKPVKRKKGGDNV